MTGFQQAVEPGLVQRGIAHGLSFDTI